MKQVPTFITSSILIVLTLFPGFISAEPVNKYVIDFSLLNAEDHEQVARSDSLFEELQIESSFLFSHYTADGYTIGLNYTDVTLFDNDRASKSDSNLLVMLQFSF